MSDVSEWRVTRMYSLHTLPCCRCGADFDRFDVYLGSYIGRVLLIMCTDCAQELVRGSRLEEGCVWKIDWCP